ncbi:MAG TPA: hypothetical protein VKN74_02635 [Candidatus Mcinerneyibacterium sp.]|nr:hypothetical protein [Candidatus Mcinerneyibacterium sp.]
MAKNFREYTLQNWEFNGESAKCLYGIHVKNPQRCAYPLDPDDLCRCIQALRFMFGDYEDSIQHHIQKVANYYKSKVWDRFAQDWSKLLQVFFEEWESKSAPRTYEYMQDIINTKGKLK